MRASVKLFCAFNLLSWQIQLLPDDMPFAQAKGPGIWKRQSQEEFAPIRIHTVFDSSVTALPAARKIFQASSGPFQRALTVLSNSLLVRPFQGNFTIPPLCTNYITNGSNAGKCFADSVNPATACGTYFNVSADFVGSIEACTTANGSCALAGPDGSGVAGADFVLFAGATTSKFKF